ncbi:DUF7504 family protein [Halalkalirubrum salinum]|uniref:DUF7504 family protein n=1 Tax=Halalkalirubrum salinum TaxID=2563889 RepID=UPI0010FB53FC|nr:hypothetical protein [Halalkalirubrum salinum]
MSGNESPPIQVPDIASDAIVISGPPMSGKYQLLLRLLGAIADRAIVVSTGHDAETISEEYQSLTGHDDRSIGVIDCVTREQRQSVTDTELRKYASSPKNLTEIGVKFTELTEVMDGQDVAVGVHSLSQLLMYWEADRIYQFTRVLLGQARSQGWPVIAVINPTMHDEQVVHTLVDPFDTVVDTRVSETAREFRVRNRTSSPSEWRSF